MQNQTNLNNLERVEVMALFGYQMTPCQPLTFKRHGYDESEVTELLRTHIRFVGNTAIHVFDVLVGKVYCRLMFNAKDLTWHIAAD